MYFDSTYRVSYADTDQMGVVYYGNYMMFFERARTEMLRAAGFPYSELERRGWLLMVTEAHCKYIRPALYDDLLTFRSHVEEIGKVRIRIVTRVMRDGELLAEGYVTLGCVDRSRRLARLDPELVKVCEQFSLEEDK